MAYTEDQAALLVAMDKKLSPMVKQAKAELRDKLLDMAGEGADSLALRANGQKVGKVTLREGKPKVQMLQPEDDAMSYLASLGLTEAVLQPVDGWESAFAVKGEDVFCRATGEDVSNLFCVVRKPPTTAVTGCKPDDVLEALGTDKAVALLTEGLV